MSLFIPLLGVMGIGIYYLKPASTKKNPMHDKTYTLPPKLLKQDTGEYRHQTFDTIADYVTHPDVVNNNFTSEPVRINRGEYGMTRYNGKFHKSSNITQFYRTDNLIV